MPNQQGGGNGGRGGRRGPRPPGSGAPHGPRQPGNQPPPPGGQPGQPNAGARQARRVNAGPQQPRPVELPEGEVLSNKVLQLDPSRPGEYMAVVRVGDRDCRVRVYAQNHLFTPAILAENAFDIKVVRKAEERDGRLEARAVLVKVHGTDVDFRDEALYKKKRASYDQVEGAQLQHGRTSRLRDFEYGDFVGDDERGSYFQFAQKKANTQDGRGVFVRSLFHWHPAKDLKTGRLTNPDIPVVVTGAYEGSRNYEAVPEWQFQLTREYTRLNAMLTHWHATVHEIATESDRIRAALRPKQRAAFDAARTNALQSSRAVMDVLNNARSVLARTEGEMDLDARTAEAYITNEFQGQVRTAVAAFETAYTALKPYVSTSPDGRYPHRSTLMIQNGESLRDLRSLVESVDASAVLPEDEFADLLNSMELAMREISTIANGTEAANAGMSEARLIRGGEGYLALQDALRALRPEVRIGIDPSFRSNGLIRPEHGTLKKVDYVLSENGSHVRIGANDLLFDFGVEDVDDGAGGTRRFVTFDTQRTKAQRDLGIERLRTLLLDKKANEGAITEAQEMVSVNGLQRCTIDEFIAMVQAHVIELAEGSASAREIGLMARVESANALEVIRFLNSTDHVDLVRDRASAGLVSRLEAAAARRMTEYVRGLHFMDDLPWTMEVARLQNDRDASTAQFTFRIDGLPEPQDIPLTGNAGPDGALLRARAAALDAALVAVRAQRAEAVARSEAARRDALIAHIGNAPIPELIGYMNGQQLANGSLAAEYRTRRTLRTADTGLHEQVTQAILARVQRYMDLPTDPSLRIEPAYGDVDELTNYTFRVGVDGAAGEAPLFATQTVTITGDAANDKAVLDPIKAAVRRALKEGRAAREAERKEAERLEAERQRTEFLDHIAAAPLRELVGYMNEQPLAQTFPAPYDQYRALRADTALLGEVHTAVNAVAQQYLEGLGFASDLTFTVERSQLQNDLDSSTTQFIVVIEGLVSQDIALTGDAAIDRKALRTIQADLAPRLQGLRDAHDAARDAVDQAEVEARLRTYTDYLATHASMNEIVTYLNGRELPDTFYDAYRRYANVLTGDASVLSAAVGAIVDRVRSYTRINAAATIEIGHPTSADLGGAHTFLVTLTPSLDRVPLSLTGDRAADRAQVTEMNRRVEAALTTERDARDARERAAQQKALRDYISADASQRELIDFLNGFPLSQDTLFAPYRSRQSLFTADRALYDEIVNTIVTNVAAYCFMNGVSALRDSAVSFTMTDLGNGRAGPFMVGVAPDMSPRPFVITGDVATDRAELDRMRTEVERAVNDLRPARERAGVTERLTALGLPGVIGYLNGRRLMGADGRTPMDAPFTTIQDFRTGRQEMFAALSGEWLTQVRTYLGLPADDAVVLDFGHPNADPNGPYTFRVGVTDGTAVDMPMTDVALTGNPATDRAVRDTILQQVTEALERREQRESAGVREMREGMTVVVRDMERLAAHLSASSPDGLASTWTLRHQYGVLVVDLGAGFGIYAPDSDEFEQLQRAGIIEVTGAPPDFGARAEDSLIEMCRQLHIDPPVRPGEVFVYRGPSLLDGRIPNGARLVMHEAYANGERNPAETARVFFWYESAISPLGDIADTGGTYTSGPQRGQAFAPELSITLDNFARLLNSRGNQRFERVAIGEAVGTARAAVELLNRVEGGAAVQNGPEYFRALGLPTTEIGGRNIVRFRWTGPTIPATREGVGAFETNSVWRIVGTEQNNVLVVRENELGVAQDAAHPLRLELRQVLRMVQAFELPPSDPFFIRLARSSNPQFPTPESAHDTFQVRNLFRMNVTRQILPRQPQQPGQPRRATTETVPVNMTVHSVNSSQVVFNVIGDRTPITLSHDDFFGRVAAGEIGVEPWRATQATEALRGTPPFAVEARAGAPEARFTEMVRAYGITIERPLDQLAEGHMVTAANEPLELYTTDEGILRFGVLQPDGNAVEHAMTYEQFAIALHFGRYRLEGAQPTPPQGGPGNAGPAAPGAAPTPDARRRAPGPDTRGPFPADPYAQEQWFAEEPGYETFNQEIRETYPRARAARDAYYDLFAAYLTARRAIEAVNAAGNPSTVRVQTREQGDLAGANLSRQQEPSWFGRLIGRRPSEPRTTQRYPLSPRLRLLNIPLEGHDPREYAAAYNAERAEVEGEIAAMNRLNLRAEDRALLERRAARIGTRVPSVSPERLPTEDEYRIDRLGGFTPQALAQLPLPDREAIVRLNQLGFSFTELHNGFQDDMGDLTITLNSSGGVEVSSTEGSLRTGAVSDLVNIIESGQFRRRQARPEPGAISPAAERNGAPARRGMEELFNDPAAMQRFGNLNRDIVRLAGGGRFNDAIAVTGVLAPARARLQALAPQVEAMRGRITGARTRYSNLDAARRNDAEFNAIAAREQAVVARIEDVVTNIARHVDTAPHATEFVNTIVPEIQAELTAITEAYERLAPR